MIHRNQLKAILFVVNLPYGYGLVSKAKATSRTVHLGTEQQVPATECSVAASCDAKQSHDDGEVNRRHVLARSASHLLAVGVVSCTRPLAARADAPSKALNQGPKNKRIGGLVARIRGVSHVMVGSDRLAHFPHDIFGERLNGVITIPLSPLAPFYFFLLVMGMVRRRMNCSEI
jgi:hypothetical protein